MEFLIDNWYILLALLFLIMAAIVMICRFLKLPTEEQLENVREWLLGVVTDMERELGGGTGQLKLRKAYDLFIERFPWLAKVVSFARFSELVDDALEIMRDMIAKNVNVAAYVGVDVEDNTFVVGFDGGGGAE